MGNVNYALMHTAERQAETTQDRLKHQLAALRWRKEVEGTQITADARFQTDRATRAELATLFTNFENGLLDAPVAWKAQSGWLMLGQDMLRQVLWLIHAHVQACFLAEKLLTDQIEAGDITHGDALPAAFQDLYSQAREGQIKP